MSYNMPATS